MRAKRVTNVPRLNEELDQASLLRKYEPERTASVPSSKSEIAM